MKQLLRRNLGLKLFSLLLAYLAWAAVVGRPQKPIVHEISVLAPPGPDSYVVRYEPKNIKVQLTGDPSALKPEVLQGVHAKLDIGHLAPGEQQYPVTPAEIQNVPKGVTVDVIDSVVTLTVEQRGRRPVDVKVNSTGNPAEGFLVHDIRTEPERVSAVGAQSRVAELESVPTELLDLEGRSAPFEQQLKIMPAGSNVYFDPSSVRVVVEIREETVEESFELVIEGIPAGWQVRPNTVSVTVSAPASRFIEVRDSAAAGIEFEELPETTASVPVGVSFPRLPGVTRRAVEIRAIEPQSVLLERSSASP